MSGKGKHGKRKHPVWRVLLILFLAALTAYLGVVGMVVWKKHHLPPVEDYGAIVVLGAQVKPDGTPNIQLQWRLDAALEAWKKTPCWIVVCGAQGFNEPAPEGEVMRTYLMAHGVPEEQILVDVESFNTRENLRNAAQLLEGKDVSRVCVVTSDYHVPRALALAEDEGFEACGIPSPTLGGWWLVKNHAREAIAWIKYWCEKITGAEFYSITALLGGAGERKP
ncbi:MAG: YdcF family protein [Clostridia bacterium]|nr:YdcF family protein [Clostridia bacterium]